MLQKSVAFFMHTIKRAKTFGSVLKFKDIVEIQKKDKAVMRGRPRSSTSFA